MIDFLLYELGMREFGGKVAVVGEQEHAGGVAVEATDGIYSFWASTLHKVHNREATVGVVAGCYAVLGFVEQDVAFAFGCNNLFCVFNDIGAADFCAEFGNHLTIDLDEALLDEFVGFAARADAGVTHIFVQTNLFVGIGNGYFVFYALGTGSEALAASWEAVLVVALVVAVLAGPVVVCSLALIIVISALAGTVAVSSLALIVVISALTGTVAVATLALIVVVSALSGTVIVSALTLVVLTVVISALTLLIGTLLVGTVVSVVGIWSCIRVFALGGLAFGSGSAVEILTLRTRLIRTVVTVIVSALTLLIGALLVRTLLIRAFGMVTFVFAAFGFVGRIVVGRTLVAWPALAVFRSTESCLPDAWAFRLFFRRIGFHIDTFFDS